MRCMQSYPAKQGKRTPAKHQFYADWYLNWNLMIQKVKKLQILKLNLKRKRPQLMDGLQGGKMHSEAILKDLLDNVGILIKNAEEKIKADATTPTSKRADDNATETAK